MLQYTDILEKDIDKITFVILDLETTGLQAQFKDRIVEIGAIKVLNGKVIDELSTLINPRRPLNLGAYKINKIEIDELTNAPVFHQFSNNLLKFIKDSVIVAYNAPFDISFLEKEFRLINVPVNFFLQPKQQVNNNFLYQRVAGSRFFGFYRQPLPDSIYVVDVLTLARNLFPKLPKYNQSFITDYLGINQQPTHRALQDVYSAAQIFQIIISILRNFGFNKFKYLISPDIQRKLFEVRLQKLNLAIQNKSKIKINYLDTHSNKIMEFSILPYNIDSAGLILNAFSESDNDQKHFFIDRIFKVDNADKLI